MAEVKCGHCKSINLTVKVKVVFEAPLVQKDDRKVVSLEVKLDQVVEDEPETDGLVTCQDCGHFWWLNSEVEFASY